MSLPAPRPSAVSIPKHNPGRPRLAIRSLTTTARASTVLTEHRTTHPTRVRRLRHHPSKTPQARNPLNQSPPHRHLLTQPDGHAAKLIIQQHPHADQRYNDDHHTQPYRNLIHIHTRTSLFHPHNTSTRRLNCLPMALSCPTKQASLLQKRVNLTFCIDITHVSRYLRRSRIPKQKTLLCPRS